jgi:hypothetical protein
LAIVRSIDSAADCYGAVCDNFEFRNCQFARRYDDREE